MQMRSEYMGDLPKGNPKEASLRKANPRLRKLRLKKYRKTNNSLSIIYIAKRQGNLTPCLFACSYNVTKEPSLCHLPAEERYFPGVTPVYFLNVRQK